MDILDDEMGFNPDAKLATLTSFDFEHEAYLCKAALENEGIRCALTNTNMSNVLSGAVLSIGGIKVIVKEEDLDKAQVVLAQIEKNKTQDVDEDFREADHEDILYQKAIQEKEQSFPKWLWLMVALIIALLVFQILRFSSY